MTVLPLVCSVYDPKARKMRTKTNIYHDRIIRRLTKSGRKYQANRDRVSRLFGGKRAVTVAGQGLNPDHIHELQLDGQDT